MLLQNFACDQAHSSPTAAAAAAAAAPIAASAAHPTSAPFSPPPFSVPRTTCGLPTGLFVSPPASPPHVSATPNALGNLFTTCRSLQAALLSTTIAPVPAPVLTPTQAVFASAYPPTSATPSFPLTPPQQRGHHRLEQLTPPPPTHAPSPMRLRLRPRKAAAKFTSTTNTEEDCAAVNTNVNANASARRRIVKRMPPAHGPNKRRRSAGDDHNSGDDCSDERRASSEKRGDEMYPQPSLAPYPFSSLTPLLIQTPGLLPAPFLQHMRRPTTPIAPITATDPATPPRPQTPRRARIAPEALPLGLVRSDFHTLHADGIPDDSSACAAMAAAEVEREADGEGWSLEDDRMLVELVLEKLQLSKTDWQDCARSLGKKDRHSVGRRWKSLMLGGDVGLRPGARSSRRSRIHGTWR